MNSTRKLLTLVMLAVFCLPGVLRAQGAPQQIPTLPADPDVKIGTLPNGLTYYIRHNAYPKGQADFYIAQKVGSILEEDSQRGLAHFLEHMCFNGTKHFPGNQIVDWLETKGVKFGQNLNAYTGVDETVYNISNVPVANKAVQDSCLLILHDWANDLLLDGEEIDKERGVIHEEWRSRMVGSMRVLEQVLPNMYPGSKYGVRLPIGTMEVVDNFPHQALRDYYEKWYRPELQGVIVVGDIDPAYIEGKIKELFADIPATVNGAKREYLPVADHKGTLYAIGTDKELQYNAAVLMWLSDPLPDEYRNTAAFYQVNYLQNMVTAMLNQRFQDILNKPNAPFAAASGDFGGYLVSARTKECFQVEAVSAGNDVVPALAAAYREVLRAARGGFTVSEYDRAKAQYLSSWETRYNNRATRENGEFVQAYVRNFLDGDPMPAIDLRYTIAQQLAAAIPVDMINAFFKEVITEDNRVLYALIPDKDGIVLPTENSVATALAAVDAENIEAFKEEVRTDPLIAKMPRPGKITGEKKLAQWDAIEWTLSNGARVIVKPTKFKEDQILFYGQALDGYSKMGKEFDNDIVFSEYSLDNFGLGAYTTNDLTKYLSGKMVSLTPRFDSSVREVDGSATPKDLPTLMELTYMLFTDPVYNTEEFAALQAKINSILEHQTSDPNFVFQQRMLETVYKSPRRRMITPEIVSAASAARTTELVKTMLNNPADFTFTFVGNVDPAVLRPLVEQYIASIPGNPSKAVKKVEKFDDACFVTPGAATDVFTTKMETPQTFVAILETGTMPYSPRDAQIASMAGSILSKRLLKTVREEMGAVYSIGAGGRESRLGPSNVMLQTMFPMKPEMRDEVLKFIAGEIKNMETNVTDDELAPVKEFMLKEVAEGREKNGSWLNGIGGWLLNGQDAFNTAADNISSVTVKDVQNFVKKLNDQNNYRVVILEAEK